MLLVGYSQLLLIQVAIVATAFSICLIDVESIVGTWIGYMYGFVVVALAYRRRARMAFWLGLSTPTIAVVCLALIIGFKWSPNKAQVPITTILGSHALLVLALAVAALEESQGLAPGRRPLRIRFGIGVLMGIMLATCLPFGFWRVAGRPGLGIGLVAAWIVLASLIVRTFYR